MLVRPAVAVVVAVVVVAGEVVAEVVVVVVVVGWWWCCWFVPFAYKRAAAEEIPQRRGVFCVMITFT